MLTAKENKDEIFIPTLISDFFLNAAFFGKNLPEKEFGQSLLDINIKENKNEFELDIVAPGFRKNDFNVKANKNTINISAEEESEENKKNIRKENSFTSFSRTFTLPESVDFDKIDAKYNDRILKLIILKKKS